MNHGEDLRLEIVKLKKETQFWKNRFEQAQTSYNELDKELTDVRKSFEEELVETRSQFEKVKNELEHSKENNDLLKKMGKIIVEKFEIRNKPDVQTVPPKTKAKVAQHSDDSIEVIESEQVTIEDVEDEDGEQFTEQIVANKLRGFRRTDPSKPAEQQKSSLKKSVSFASVTANGSATSRSPLETPKNSKQTSRILYRHFFNNTGACVHGNECKFSHSRAPICRYDMHCNKQKCMFQHPQRNSFLGSRPTSFSPPPPMSPWPWMFPQMDPNMFPPQWNNQIRSNNQSRGWGNQNRN